jgi:glycosyltransferase involved in cell wall biosynthesis
MFDNKDPFFSRPKAIVIPESAKIIVVADMFVEDYVGGAELTTQSLIDSSPFEVFKIHSKDLTLQLLQQGVEKFWIFGNFTAMDARLIPSIVANLRYVILEYDYKFCKFRSPEKHMASTGMPCNCSNDINGKMVSAFFHGAACLFWMSEKQKDRYHTAFPFLAEQDNRVLSSVFSKETLGQMILMRHAVKKEDRTKWIVLGSNSWIKGAAQAEQWCKDNDKEYEVVWNIPYDELLAKLAHAEGFVYLPLGGDTCPRMVIEAKLLGCELILNDNVQHKDEEWFATDDIQSINDYLYASPGVFWNYVKSNIDFVPTISGYTTVFNASSQDYPFEESISSMLQFCDEVCVVDGGSTDDTKSKLFALQLKNLTITNQSHSLDDNGFIVESRLKVKVVERDWSHPRFAVFDGLQKAEARAMCTKDFCWQMDSDEVVHEDDVPKIVQLCRKMPKEIDLISLPVIEYWGSADKVRMDVLPWKWRLSRNKPNITHGIPAELRLTDENGNLYAREGTDGCDMIDATTFERIPHVSFYNYEVDTQRRMGLVGDNGARQAYEMWFNSVTAQLPGVFHYSWFDLERKIRLYRDYWTKHWESLRGCEYLDLAEQNMMFDVPWSQVTNSMIQARAIELNQIGGWIWHRKWDGTKTPWITCNRTEPKLMIESHAERKTHCTDTIIKSQ